MKVMNYYESMKRINISDSAHSADYQAAFDISQSHFVELLCESVRLSNGAFSFTGKEGDDDVIH